LIEKTTTWADKARMGHLNQNAAWLNLTTTLLHQINYVLPATNLSPQQCEKIMWPYLQTRLLAAGYSCSFPQAIVHTPLWHFGLGLTDLHTKQGITHLLLLLKHGYQMDDLTGQLICGSMENMLLELRFPGSLFKLPYNDFQQLATKSWIKVAWQFQQTHNICIETDIPDQTVTRVNDTLIMLSFHVARFRGNDLSWLNRCRIYLQCTTLANLCNGSSNYLNPDMWAGHPNTTFISGYTWPNQSKPTKQDWIC